MGQSLGACHLTCYWRHSCVFVSQGYIRIGAPYANQVLITVHRTTWANRCLTVPLLTAINYERKHWVLLVFYRVGVEQTALERPMPVTRECELGPANTIFNRQANAR